MSTGRVVTLGEIMLRLKPPGFERFLQSPVFEATFGGGEANVAISLATFGLQVAFVTALPLNPVADACIRYLRGYGVDTSSIIRQGERIGIYFLEAGSNQRPSSVIYDRAHSPVAAARPEDFDWDRIFDGAAWFHITGITPALSQSAADLSLHAIHEARVRNVTVCCDFSYRKKLWQYGMTEQEVMTKIVKEVDVVIASEEDCQRALGVSVHRESQEGHASNDEPDMRHYKMLSEAMFAAFPNLRYHAMTVRKGYDSSHNAWSACLSNGQTLFTSRRYDIANIVDRVGSGDAFAAGLIYGLHTGIEDEQALNFAAAAACLKHSIPGDANLVTTDEVMQLINGETSGRVQR